jgi:alkaline phosphatase
MMVSDGFGPASETFARQYHAWDNNLPYKSILPLDTIHVGQSRTQSSSSLVTDSAAGATAFSCGLKSYNGAIGGECGIISASFIKAALSNNIGPLHQLIQRKTLVERFWNLPKSTKIC